MLVGIVVINVAITGNELNCIIERQGKQEDGDPLVDAAGRAFDAPPIREQDGADYGNECGSRVGEDRCIAEIHYVAEHNHRYGRQSHRPEDELTEPVVLIISHYSFSYLEV